MLDKFEFTYHGVVVTATIEMVYRPETKPCADCRTNGYVSREYVESVLELQEDGGVLVLAGAVPLKRVRKEATERLNFRPQCNKCREKEVGFLYDY